MGTRPPEFTHGAVRGATGCSLQLTSSTRETRSRGRRDAAAEGLGAGRGQAGVLGRRRRGRAGGSGVGGKRIGKAEQGHTSHSRGTREAGEEASTSGRMRHAGPRRRSSPGRGCPLRSGPSVHPARRASAARQPRPPCSLPAALSSGRGKRGSGVTSTQVQARTGHPLDRVSRCR